MPDLILIGVAAALTALMTFFSGFGLGTLMLPVYALFLPLPMAVLATAIVHGLNNLLKFSLLRHSVQSSVFLKFGVPAWLAAALGAWVLLQLVVYREPIVWQLASFEVTTQWLSLVIGSLMLAFAVFELAGGKKRWQWSAKWLPLGGLLSGFFGGLSGHQGAFRAMFLLKTGLTAPQFVATQSAIALLVDMTRILVYLASGAAFATLTDNASIDLVGWLAAGLLGAAVGTLIGRRYIEKTTLALVRYLASGLLIVVALAMILGKI